jgi:hypothetical protein
MPSALLPRVELLHVLMLPDFERREERLRNITNSVIDVAHFTYGDGRLRLMRDLGQHCPSVEVRGREHDAIRMEDPLFRGWRARDVVALPRGHGVVELRRRSHSTSAEI